MSLEDILVALRAVEEGAIDRDELTRLLAIIDTWDRGGLHPSAGELLTRRFRVEPARVRRWEREITGESQRRIGRYQLIRKVGQGGMGLVFEARDPNLGRTVALKLLAGDRLENPTSVQRFLREQKSAGAFNHPNIVHAFDAGIDGDLPYLVMEFVDGENLYQLLKRHGSIDPSDGVEWMLQGARALEVLERQRWVHGDVKPSNFIVTRDGVLKLADLGLCGPPGKPRPGTSPHGTPPYVAPEVLAGDHIDHRADLYSLGATWYHLFAGRPHRPARTMDELITLGDAAVEPLRSIRPEVSTTLAGVIHRLLETRARDRYPDGHALIEALEPLRSPPVAEPDAPTELEPEPVGVGNSPRRGIWAALIVTVVAVGIAVGLSFAGRHLGDRSREDPTSGGPTATEPGAPAGAAAAARLARWEEVRADAGDDPRALFAWLAGEGAEYPEADRWRAEVVERLTGLAGDRWRSIDDEQREHRAAGRYHRALVALDRFPEEWRAGPFGVAWEEAVEATRRERRGRLARILLDLDGEASPLARWQVWSALRNESPEDRAWFRSRIERELGGLPFLIAIDRAVSEEAARRARRPAAVRTALRQGRIPEPDLVPSARLPEELALLWLSAHPSVAGTAGPLLPRIHDAGHLGSIDPRLLGWLLAQVGETADPVAEAEAARLATAAETARRSFDLAAAEAAWVRLARAPHDGTVAARAALARVELDRAALRRGAFLRSGSFAAEVTGAWGSPPRFRWVGDDRELSRDWRFQPERWSVEAGGRRSRGREPIQGIELGIPFAPVFAVSLEVEVPDDDWVLFVGRGEGAVGFAGEGAGGRCRATAGSRDAVAAVLSAGRGAPWQLPEDPEVPGRVRIELEYLRGTWRLLGGNGLSFPIGEDPAPAWIWLAIPDDGLLRTVELTGEPVETWLEARREWTEEP